MLNLRSRTARRAEAMKLDRLIRALEHGLAAQIEHELEHTAKIAAQAVEHEHALHVSSQMHAHRERLFHILSRSWRLAFRTFARYTLKEIRKAVKSDDDEDVINDAAQDFIDTYGAKKVTGLANTTLTRIKNALDDGLDEEDSWSDIARSIVRRTGGDVGRRRAMIIAQTEMHGAAQAGSLAGAKASGVDDLKKVWNSMHDDRVREDHEDADGQSVPVDDTFSVGDDDLDHPGDMSGSPEEVINCRCVMTYETPDD